MIGNDMFDFAPLRSAPLWKSVSNIMVKLQKSFKIVWLFHGIDGAHSMNVHYVHALNFLSIFAIPSKFIVPTDKTGSEKLVLGRFLRHTSMLLRVLKFQLLFQFTLDWLFKLFLLRQIYETKRNKELREWRCFTVNSYTQLIQSKWNS